MNLPASTLNRIRQYIRDGIAGPHPQASLRGIERELLAIECHELLLEDLADKYDVSPLDVAEWLHAKYGTLFVWTAGAGVDLAEMRRCTNSPLEREIGGYGVTLDGAELAALNAAFGDNQAGHAVGRGAAPIRSRDVEQASYAGPPISSTS